MNLFSLSAYFYEKAGDGVYNIREIEPIKSPFMVVNKYSKKDTGAEYAIRISYKIDGDIPKEWLEFSFYANHGFSNTTACIRKKYTDADISEGIFETGTSMKILKVPD